METALFTAQYALVQDARAVLLDYCATLNPAYFTAPVAAFNASSPRDLLTHVINCYQHWLGAVALAQPSSFLEPADLPDVPALRAAFAAVDELVAEWLRTVGNWQQAQPLTGRRTDQPMPLQLTPLQLFTHVVTHEFHHKGQVLTMTRLLGYTPIDTDIIRT